ncbi:unnamed protein product, partial [Rotaria magnacalcarata]
MRTKNNYNFIKNDFHVDVKPKAQKREFFCYLCECLNYIHIHLYGKIQTLALLKRNAVSSRRGSRWTPNS